MFSVPGKAMNKQAGNHASYARYKRKNRKQTRLKKDLSLLSAREMKQKSRI